jgi:hypothetical protein
MNSKTRTSDSGHGVLDVWLPFCGAGGFEAYGGGILVVVEGDAAIPGVSGPQRGVSSGWLPMLLLAEALRSSALRTTFLTIGGPTLMAACGLWRALDKAKLCDELIPAS